jgi:group I intron endonuclease
LAGEIRKFNSMQYYRLEVRMEKIELVWDAKQCGVYCIRNTVNGKVYIGSSKNCYHRVRGQHYDKLARGCHTNRHLQAAWNKYGRESFESFCVEICDCDMLSQREQYWIDSLRCLDPAVGYNQNPLAERRKYTEEQKASVSIKNLGRQRREVPTGIWKVKNKYGDSWMVTISFCHDGT